MSACISDLLGFFDKILFVPAEYVELKIYHKEIIKVLIHFGRQMPVLFFYTRPAAAAKIRKALKMDDKNDFYYDTMSSGQNTIICISSTFSFVSINRIILSHLFLITEN